MGFKCVQNVDKDFITLEDLRQYDTFIFKTSRGNTAYMKLPQEHPDEHRYLQLNSTREIYTVKYNSKVKKVTILYSIEEEE